MITKEDYEKLKPYLYKEIRCIKSMYDEKHFESTVKKVTWVNEGNYYELTILNHYGEVNNSTAWSIEISHLIRFYTMESFLNYFRLITEKEYLAEQRRNKINKILDE